MASCPAATPKRNHAKEPFLRVYGARACIAGIRKDERTTEGPKTKKTYNASGIILVLSQTISPLKELRGEEGEVEWAMVADIPE